ncbi:hypothetical protein BaRGS_00005259 [Batillaria attramentaria]|uniref:Ribosomal protein L2 n=1 Tax=Batillaria attramentaria TaxID=370345 RepID=A0ABD0LVW0_9CAEN
MNPTHLVTASPQVYASNSKGSLPREWRLQPGRGTGTQKYCNSTVNLIRSGSLLISHKSVQAGKLLQIKPSSRSGGGCRSWKHGNTSIPR